MDSLTRCGFCLSYNVGIPFITVEIFLFIFELGISFQRKQVAPSCFFQNLTEAMVLKSQIPRACQKELHCKKQVSLKTCDNDDDSQAYRPTVLSENSWSILVGAELKNI